jgi:dipeptidyl aminopeptidase/acylaminoacyl peptidase
MAEPVAAADYHDIVRVSDPQLSPDGERVAFVRRRPSDDETYEATVYVVDADGRTDARRFTAAEGVDAAPRWSPSGDRLAFTSTRDGGAGTEAPQLFVLPVAGGEAERVTDVPGGVSEPTWSPDGSRIAFVQSTTAAERASGVDRDVANAGGEADDGYERETPDPRVVDRLVYRRGTEYLDGARPHVYLAHLDRVDGAAVGGGGDGCEGGGEGDGATPVVERVTDGEFDHATPAWGDASTLYLSAKRTGEEPDDSPEIDLLAYDTGAGALREVGRTTGWGTDLAATADGRLAHVRTPPERLSMRQAEVDVLDVGTGAVRTLTAGLDRTVADAGVEWDPAERCVHFLTPDEGRVLARRVRDPESGAGDANGDGDGAGADADAAGGGEPTVETLTDAGHATGFSPGTDATAVVRSEWDHRGDVFLARHGDGDDAGSGGSAGTAGAPGGVTRLTEVNADYLDARRVGEPEEVRFESDGHEVQGWVLYPPGAADAARGGSDGQGEEGGRDGGDDADGGDRDDVGDEGGEHPVVLEIHGGPHAMWSTSDTMWHEYQTLAARGYVVFWCNPRGSTGYGEAFATAVERDWGATTMRDLVAGFEAVADRPGVDGDDAFVTGGSFGGFMTGWIVGHTDRFRGAVAQRGVYDLPSFYGTTDAFKLVEWDFGTVPWDEPGFLREQSPVAHVDSVTTPTLLVHGDLDFRVPVSDAETFYRLLRKQGVDTRLVRYPREGHELSRSGEPGHVVDRLERIVRWFDGYSTHHDAPPALERGDDGLSAGRASRDGRGSDDDD